MRAPDLTLDVAADWIEQHCAIPDSFDAGEMFELVPEQLLFVQWHYAVKPTAKPGELATAFVHRRSQLVRAQKWGKSPLIAAFVCLEGVGPCLFDGFAAGGEQYLCSEHGCGCGWVYEYVPGEPMGKCWPTPLIQVTATTEDQTDNTYGALRPMIDRGPLSEVIPRTGEEFIRLPGGGRIDVVTSKANSRLGQRVTFVPQDETGIWTDSNGMTKTARTQRRGLAGMGGRAIETTNSWDPAENSQAQRTFESPADDIYKDYRQPPADLRWTNRADRHKIMRFNYAGVPWALKNLAGIEAEVEEMNQRDAAEAERFFGNRIVYGQGAWLPAGQWDGAYAGESVAENAI
ncbi:MAG: terminase [Rhodoglobus sp.]